MNKAATKILQDLFKYFVHLDKIFNINNFTLQKMGCKNLLQNTNNSYRFQMRFNNYLYYLEIFHSLFFNKPLFGLNSFSPNKYGFEFKYLKMTFSQQLFVLKNNEVSNCNMLNSSIKKLCIGITKYYSIQSDRDLLRLISDDPLWKNNYSSTDEVNLVKKPDLNQKRRLIKIIHAQVIKNNYTSTLREIISLGNLDTK